MSRKFNVKPTANHITEARYSGSQERVVGANGEINAGSTSEVMQRLVDIANMIQQGDVYTDVSGVADGDAITIEEAFANDEDWAELGSGLAAELQERMLREGFMRTIFDRASVAEGSIPRVRVRTPNVKAIIARGIGQNYPQYVRDRYIAVDEFTVSANPRVESLEMHQGSGDLLEDKFYEAQEAIMVAEDNVAIGLIRSSVGIYNAPTYFAGAFTPTVLQGMRQAVTDWNLPATNLLFANDLLSDMLVGNDFSTWFDPITKWEVIQTGRIGSLLGLNLITDAYREPTLQVMKRGEAMVLTQPNYLGAYTDRGPVTSTPTDGANDGIVAKGWFLSEHISQVLANAKGAAVAQRT